ncbi:40618_t:CDS:2, partial [Gigaspora margarita]
TTILKISEENEYCVSSDFSDNEQDKNDDHDSLHNKSEQDELSNAPTHETETKENPDLPVCKVCKTVFSSDSATSTLRRHLEAHNIVAPKRGRKPMNSNPYLENEQK